MDIEFGTIEDQYESPQEYLVNYNHESDLSGAKEDLIDLGRYEIKLRKELITVNNWKKQLTNWIINAEKPV